MLTSFSLACLGLVLSSVLGCAADVAPLDTDNHEPVLAGQSFEVQVPRDVTAETVIPALVEGAREELASVCEAAPDTAIRIMNPLAIGTFEDVSCAWVLERDESTAATNAALTSNESDGPIGTVQQEWSFVGMACSALMIGSGLVANRLICPRATNPQDHRGCGNLSDAGFSTLGFCASCSDLGFEGTYLMERTPRILALLATGGVLVASHVLCYQRAPQGDFGITDLLHYSFPLTIYILANLLIDEGRARERERARSPEPRPDPGQGDRR